MRYAMPDSKINPTEVLATTVLSGDIALCGCMERAVWADRMLACLRHGGPEGGINTFFAEVGLFSLEQSPLAYVQFHRGPTNRRAVCGKSARTVRREGRPG